MTEILLPAVVAFAPVATFTFTFGAVLFCAVVPVPVTVLVTVFATAAADGKNCPTGGVCHCPFLAWRLAGPSPLSALSLLVDMVEFMEKD